MWVTERGQCAAAPVLVSSVSQLCGCHLHADSRPFVFAAALAISSTSSFQHFISLKPASLCGLVLMCRLATAEFACTWGA